jgi:glycosyltransferase involved in cell wall biosynthesis
MRILLISTGDFSGIKRSLIMELRRAGCIVIDGKVTLRHLRFRVLHILFMFLNALISYKFRFRALIARTRAAYYSLSKASAALVERNNDIDVVIMIGANFLNFWKTKKRGVVYTLFTDHTNLLSKRLPDYGFAIPEKQVRPYWNRIERKVLSQQDHIFVMGSHVKESLVQDYGACPEQVTVIGGGPNLDVDIERDGVLKDYGQRRILFVGLDPERKGLKVLTKAFAEVRRVFPDSTLHVAGVDGLSANGISYYGNVRGERLKDLFYSSQVFALPAFREPFGVVFLEAMLSKAVCIGTKIEAVPEIIVNGQTGFLIKPNDHATLAENIIALFSDREILTSMAESGYRIAKKHWGGINRFKK